MHVFCVDQMVKSIFRSFLSAVGNPTKYGKVQGDENLWKGTVIRDIIHVKSIKVRQDLKYARCSLLLTDCILF